MIRVKREYQSWVANETLEDYALRYAAKSSRRWSPGMLANTAIGGISFLALEAIGGSLTINYGFQNAFAAVILVSILIFLISLPIAYYSSVANVDIDLLTRGAGFGYIGSTLTSLIYASFTFIFFALEAAIMAQALEMSIGLNVVVGYLVCSLIIIPLAFYGVTLINRLHQWTQPVWAVLLILPFVFILYREPGVLAAWASYPGQFAKESQFSWLSFGAATGVLFSLMGQIGEQVDYLRFLPEKGTQNRIAWWAALLSAGPGWIVIGGLKILAGGLLAFLAVRAGLQASDAVVPITMYIKGYEYVFDNRTAVLVVATVFVVISQIKINVTNAYAGSLAWSNCFARLTHYHPGRVVWLVFNVLIALLLMLLGIFATLEAVLSVYSNVVIAWIGALVADLVVLKPLGISPAYIEFKRAHLYDINPVGCGAMLIASLISISAYAGLLGQGCHAFSAFIALATSFVSAITIGFATKGKYYIARADTHFRGEPQPALVQCCICERHYEPPDMAHCPFYQGAICSLCCGLENHCHDSCKRATVSTPSLDATPPGMPAFEPHFGRRLGRFFALFSITSAVVGAVFLLSYRLLGLEASTEGVDLVNILVRIYAATLLVIAVGTWWIVLSHDSRELAEGELVRSLHHLEMTRGHLVESEKMASLGGLVAGVAHEINDVSFVGVVHPEHGPGFDVWVGGGLSTNPMLAQRLGAWVPLDEVPDVFRRFVRLLPGDGLLVLAAGTSTDFLVDGTQAAVVRYGIGEGDLSAAIEQADDRGSRFAVCRGGDALGSVALRVPGEHNVLNALAALAVLAHAGVTADEAAPHLATFSGAARRYQELGRHRGVVVVDDYAHHPTEVAATLRAARSGSYRRVIAVFQPHLFSRTRYLQREFGHALTLADEAIVTDIFPAREEPEPGVTGKLIVDAYLAERPGGPVSYLPRLGDVVDHLRARVRDGDLVLTIGAGDVFRAGERLLEDLAAGDTSGVTVVTG